MQRRKFIKSTGTLVSATILPKSILNLTKNGRLRTAHVGVGGMGASDLRDIASHKSVDVVALCDVDSINLAKAKALYPKARTFADYRVMIKAMANEIDAVIVSTPDHTHAPVSMMAMDMGKAVYCQKPLTHYVSEARAMDKLAKEKNLVTQMGIQVHSFYDYRLGTELIRSGIIGKVHTVRAWSPSNWGYDGPAPIGSDPVPEQLDWNLWLGTAPYRPYKKGFYHPATWRRVLDYGCGTLGDMGVHIFDTPYNALALDIPTTVVSKCVKSKGFGFPEINEVSYEFPGTQYTADKLDWVWYSGAGAPNMHRDFRIPRGLPSQGALFIGENGKLLLPHFMQAPEVYRDGKLVNIEKEAAQLTTTHNLGEVIREYNVEGPKHYHQFVDACLGKATCSAPFSYSARLTEVILLGVVAGRFPNQILHWDNESGQFAETEANKYLDSPYRTF